MERDHVFPTKKEGLKEVKEVIGKVDKKRGEQIYDLVKKSKSFDVDKNLTGNELCYYLDKTVKFNQRAHDEKEIKSDYLNFLGFVFDFNSIKLNSEERERFKNFFLNLQNLYEQKNILKLQKNKIFQVTEYDRSCNHTYNECLISPMTDYSTIYLYYGRNIGAQVRHAPTEEEISEMINTLFPGNPQINKQELPLASSKINKQELSVTNPQEETKKEEKSVGGSKQMGSQELLVEKPNGDSKQISKQELSFEKSNENSQEEIKEEAKLEVKETLEEGIDDGNKFSKIYEFASTLDDYDPDKELTNSEVLYIFDKLHSYAEENKGKYDFSKLAKSVFGIELTVNFYERDKQIKICAFLLELVELVEKALTPAAERFASDHITKRSEETGRGDLKWEAAKVKASLIVIMKHHITMKNVKEGEIPSTELNSIKNMLTNLKKPFERQLRRGGEILKKVLEGASISMELLDKTLSGKELFYYFNGVVRFNYVYHTQLKEKKFSDLVKFVFNLDSAGFSSKEENKIKEFFLCLQKLYEQKKSEINLVAKEICVTKYDESFKCKYQLDELLKDNNYLSLYNKEINKEITYQYWKCYYPTTEQVSDMIKKLFSKAYNQKDTRESLAENSKQKPQCSIF